MYSLILIDQVVKKIDELAEAKGISRSGLVNQILAEHVSFLTPQQQIEDAFAAIGREVGGIDGLRAKQSSAGMMYIKSVLNYRYNPAIRYSVELGLESDQFVGELKVSSRTQSDTLRARLSIFYEVWSQVEATALRGAMPQFTIAGDRFARKLKIKGGEGPLSAEAAGKVIGQYLLLLDKALKMSFEGSHGMDVQIYQQILALYGEYIDAGKISI